MTYQTSPYLPWIFPDQANRMNIRGMEYAPQPPAQSLDLFHEDGVPAQVDFNYYDKKVAMDRVMNTKRAKEGMVGKLNTTERSQRYDRPASRSSVPNGVFYGSPMEYVTSGGLRGGVISTKEGQEWLAKRLLQRQEEYAQISSGNFSAGPPKHIDVSPYNNVDTLLQALFADFSSGAFTSRVNEAANQLLSAFISIGAKLTPIQLGKYSSAVGRLRETTRPYLGREMGEELGFAYEGREKRFRAIDSINQTLKLIDAVLKEIARTIYDPLPAREQVMSTLRERLLSRQIETFAPTFAGEERRAAIAEPRVPQLGRQPTYEGLLPEEGRRRNVEEEEVPIWGDEGEFGPFQAAPAPAGQGRRHVKYKIF
jgi:hypothetical protein